MNAIAQLDKIKTQIATLSDVSSVVDLRNKSKAIETYLKTQKGCADIEREAAISRLRCERRIGELLAKMSLKRGRKKVTHADQLNLRSFGITKNQSSQFQKLSKLPEPKFEAELSRASKPTTRQMMTAYNAHHWEVEKHGPVSGQQVLTGDMVRLFDDVDDNSVDCLLTDPPYAELSTYSMLAKLAAEKLKPGKLCLAYTGQYHLPEVMERMGEHLDYVWMIAIQNTGSHSAVHARKVQSKWKPILVYSKGKPEIEQYFPDMLVGSGREKNLHVWQQSVSELDYLIERLPLPGDMVVDPYAGSGTTLEACKRLGRSYLGCEIDSGTAKMARRRLKAA